MYLWFWCDLVLIFYRQWKLEHLCHKSGEPITEGYMDKVHIIRCILHMLSSVNNNFALNSLSFLNLACAFFLTLTDHRTSLPLFNYHTFGLFLGGCKVTVGNCISTVSAVFYNINQLGLHGSLSHYYDLLLCCTGNKISEFTYM